MTDYTPPRRATVAAAASDLPDDTPPLCDTCDYAQRRWDAATAGGWYPFADAPPKSPPVRHR